MEESSDAAPLWARRLPPDESIRLSRWMSMALEEAQLAAAHDDVPVGAIVVDGEEVIARAHNEMCVRGDPTAHAERLALEAGREALRLKGREDGGYLPGLTLVVTLEPCAMCTGALLLSRIPRLVFGAYDDKAGMCGSVEDLVRHPKLNHHPEVVGGVMADESAELLQRFFRHRRVR